MKNEPNSGRPTIGNSSAVNAGASHQEPQGKKDANSIWLASAGVLAILILALTVLNVQKYDFFSGDGDSEESTAGPSDESTAPESDIEPTQGTSEDGFPDSSELQALVNNGESGWIVGHQEKFQYRISGAVPSEDIRAAINTSVQETYGEDPTLVKNEITVDPTLSTEPWINNIASFLKVIPFEMVDGAFAINDEQTNLVGSASNQVKLDTVLAAATQQELPSVENSISIDGRNALTLIASARDGKIDLIGSLPEQRLIDKIVADTEVLYGEGNVNNLLSVDPNTFAAFPLINFGKVNIGTFKPLGDFDMRLAISELSATVRGGVLFPAGSATLSPDIQLALAGFPAFFKRANRPVFIFGHSDSTGDLEENRQLSQARADAVRNFFIANGVNPDTITAEGKGQEDPIESNDTPEGKSKNRRVEVVIGSAA